MKVGEVLKLNISITIGIIATLFALCIIGLYYIFPTHRNDIEFISKVIGSAAAIYSAYYVGISLKIRLENEKQDRTYKFINSLNSHESVKVRLYIKKGMANHKDISQKQQHDDIMNNEELLHAVSIVLNIFEDISLAIQRNYIDELLAYQSISGIMTIYFDYLRGFVDERRNLTQRPSTYIETQKLVDNWKNGKALYSGEKIPSLT